MAEGHEVPYETLKAFWQELKAQAVPPIKIDGKNYYPIPVDPGPFAEQLKKAIRKEWGDD